MAQGIAMYDDTPLGAHIHCAGLYPAACIRTMVFDNE